MLYVMAGFEPQGGVGREEFFPVAEILKPRGFKERGTSDRFQSGHLRNIEKRHKIAVFLFVW